jgi:MFS family permease
MKFFTGPFLELFLVSAFTLYIAWRNKKQFANIIYLVHLGISLIFLLYSVGSIIVEIFNISNEYLNEMGVSLSYLFISLLFGGVPLILVSFLLYWRDWRILILAFLFSVALTILLMLKEKTGLKTSFFTIYSILAIYFSLDWFLRRRKLINSEHRR